MVENNCPYCGSALADSKDHVFSKFLGGRRTIKACRVCNNMTFGSGFEAVVKDNLEPIMVGLELCGFKSTTPVRWSRARQDPNTGWYYDLNPTGELSLSNDQIDRDAEGHITRITIRDDPKLAEKHATSLIRKGMATEVQQQVIREPFTGQLALHLHFGEEARRLAVKMCVAVAQLELPDGKYDVLDPITRAYLLEGESPSRPVPVKFAFSNYVGLDKLRPPLSHVVHIEGDSVDRRCYGVVQFFGAIQFYVSLNAQYDGKSFARIGLLNRHLGKERFEAVSMLYLHEAPNQFFKDELPAMEQNLFRKLDDQVYAIFGKNTISFSRPDSLAPAS
jgi:hypothetical protein